MTCLICKRDEKDLQEANDELSNFKSKNGKPFICTDCYNLFGEFFKKTIINRISVMKDEIISEIQLSQFRKNKKPTIEESRLMNVRTNPLLSGKYSSMEWFKMLNDEE